MVLSFYAEEFSDDALSAHESELDRMNGFYADNVNVFKMVEKRQKLWDQKMIFEVSWQFVDERCVCDVCP